MRTITVKGMGSVMVKPDQVEISITINATDREYSAAMRTVTGRTDAVISALEGIGFGKDSLRMGGFKVDTDYKVGHDDDGRYSRVLIGYTCLNRLKLTFDLDKALLTRTLSAVSAANAEPGLNVRFTVKDSAAVSDQLTENAVKNARGKAETLCAASGVRLGSLVSIDYNWDELTLYSAANYEMDDCIAYESAGSSRLSDIDPDTIKLKDTVTCVWEIE